MIDIGADLQRAFDEGYEAGKADRPTGKWELIESEHVENIYLCSNCNNYEAWGETEKTPYCPHCGARMEAENDKGRSG
jgi:rubrerythrin